MSKMDNKKICFIMCVNNDLYEMEAMHFISRLRVPEGYTIDAISIKDAKSMVSGYNEGMQATDAKYKVYLHQDVLIVEPDFIAKMLRVFQNKEIGMLGMVGSPKLPENMIQWWGKRCGSIYSSNVSTISIMDFNIKGLDDQLSYMEVEALDGLLMATQYDIPWREDLLDKWDFYDVSQSLEFIRHGYKVVVPYMEKPWVIHDDGFVNLKNYYEERKKIIREYRSNK